MDNLSNSEGLANGQRILVTPPVVIPDSEDTSEVLSNVNVEGGSDGGGDRSTEAAKPKLKKLHFANVPTSQDEDEYQIDIEMEDLGYNIKEQDRQPLTSPLANSSLSANSPLSSVILRPPSPRSDRLRKLDHRMVRDVLDTRPTLQLGRSMSMRFRARSAFSKRPISTHSSMPQMIRCRSAGGKNRNHILAGGSQSNIVDSSVLTPQDKEGVGMHTLEGEETVEIEIGQEEIEDRTLYRQATRRLKERMLAQREQRMAQQATVVRESIWDAFKSVKWPKVKSKLKVIRSLELWKGHMKVIEGHFGTAIVSYFVFLRFLFAMNLIIFLLWFGFVVIPGAVYVLVNKPPFVESLAACVYSTSQLPGTLCPSDNLATVLNSSGSSFASEPIFYQLEELGGYLCSSPSDADNFLVQECGFVEMAYNTSLSYVVAESEGRSTINVSSIKPDNMECIFQNSSANASNMELRLCSSGISPRVLWYEYVIQFFLGDGLFNDTVIFYGRYGNSTVMGNMYSLPQAYLWSTFFVYAISIIMLVYTLGSAYNESHIQFASKRKIHFSNKVFTAWDFNITDAYTAKLEHVHIHTDLEEELADYDRRNIERNWKDLVKVAAIRFFTNLLTIIVLIGASSAIFFSAAYERNNSELSPFASLVLPVVITTLNIVLPFLFSFLARFERFKTQSGEIKMTLIRAIIVRLSSLIVLVITQYLLVSCTQRMVEDTSNTCAFSPQALTNAVSSNTTNTNCPVCWETFIGRQFYNLGITNLVVLTSGTIAVETARNIVSRIPFPGIGRRIGKGNFNISKSILDLIYTQALLWLGFFFCPIQPVVILLTTFLLFYVKRYSLTINLTPDKRGTFKSTRTNFLFVLLMLISLILILIIVGFVIGSFNPSVTCGPFRGKQYIFTVVTDVVDSLSCPAQQFIDFIASVGFVVPLVVLLLLVIYGLLVTLRSRKIRFNLIKRQLILEGANVTHIVRKLDGLLTRLSSESEHTEGDLPPIKTSHLRERILDIRKSLEDQVQ